MRRIFWTLAIGLAVLAVILAVILVPVERKHGFVRLDGVDFIEGDPNAPIWYSGPGPTEEEIHDGVALDIVTKGIDVALDMGPKGNAGGSPTEPNQPLEVGGFKEGDNIVTIWVDDVNSVSLTLEGGKLDIIGDPNHYTPAAKVLLTQSIPEAAADIVAADPNAIRRLCESGRVCAVLGHQWDVVFITLPISINGGPVGSGKHEEKCCICGRIRNRKYVEGHWADWQEKGD